MGVEYIHEAPRDLDLDYIAYSEQIIRKGRAQDSVQPTIMLARTAYRMYVPTCRTKDVNPWRIADAHSQCPWVQVEDVLLFCAT